MIGNTYNELEKDSLMQTTENMKMFGMYLWGVRDAYNESLSQMMPHVIPVQPPDDPDQYHTLWAIASVLTPYVEVMSDINNGLKAEIVNEKIESLSRYVTAVLIESIKQKFGKEVAKHMADEIQTTAQMLANTQVEDNHDEQHK